MIKVPLGPGWSDEDINSSLKQGVLVPNYLDHFGNQLVFKVPRGNFIFHFIPVIEKPKNERDSARQYLGLRVRSTPRKSILQN